MTSHSSDTSSPPSWLTDWIREAGCHSQWHSLVLGSKCGTDLHGISCKVADYLNEFDGDAGCQWRAFDIEEVRHLAGDPVCRDLILAGSEAVPPHVPPYADFERVTRRLARLGGVILEGQCGLDATTDIADAFHVCLCIDEPRGHEDYHMWVNPKRFSRHSLVSVISDSFLNWSCQHGTISKRMSETSPGHRGGGEPPFPEFAI